MAAGNLNRILGAPLTTIRRSACETPEGAKLQCLKAQLIRTIFPTASIRYDDLALFARE
ncbi:MAG: hypothetical protein JWM33_2380 [Caulobacteraceae bacterium]|nr:hypothetical protein [Caulobacteraceae bacterium]